MKFLHGFLNHPSDSMRQDGFLQSVLMVLFLVEMRILSWLEIINYIGPKIGIHILW